MLPHFDPPQLSEDLAGVYLQILATSFVFALGVVPTLAAFLVVPEDMRHVSHQLRLKRWIFSIVGFFIVSLSLVWAAPSLLRDESFATRYGHVFSYGALVVVIITPLLAAMLGPLLFYELRRTRIVPRLEKRLKNFFDREGYLESGALGDLVYLGNKGKAGAEKAMVLDALERIAKYVLKSGSYRDHVLEHLIRGLALIVAESGQLGNDENFQRAAEILKNLWREFELNRTNPKDGALAFATFQKLGIASVEKSSESSVLVYLESSVYFSSHIVFVMGLAALASKKFLAATMAMNKLESLADQGLRQLGQALSELRTLDRSGPQWQEAEYAMFLREEVRLASILERERANYEEVTANLLGLLAHFAHGGSSTRKRAELSLEQNEELFQPNVRTCRAAAFDYHYNKNAYGTSDLLVDDFQSSRG